MLTAASAPSHNEFMPIPVAVGGAEPGESELVERFRQGGEEHHFEALYVRNRRRVYSRCLAILKDRASAEDVTHETFLRAYTQFSTLQGNNFAGWVHRIATNLSLNRVRDELNRQRILAREAQVRPVPAESLDQTLVERWRLGRARQVLESLGEEQRTVLTLKYVQGHTYSEIQEKTGYTFDQVRSYLQNARRNFQLRWAERARPEESSHE